ncbi:nuclear factor Y [Abeliophyllum distichum]|uniref:Nuclear factor Y n=1 Tax=Abeliophyllum distichum TaxID=126358 RepID=A0ABD1U547_9LAMI
MAEQEPESTITESVQPEIPTRRVKRIMKLDKDINKVNAEALVVITHATEFFLQFLAEKSALVALEKKRKTIKLEHLRVAVKRHQPTSDFLLDSLPMPAQPSDQQLLKDRAKSRANKKPVPVGTRKIDAFFQKFT